MISSLFKIDGKIPVVQIILGVLIGIAGTFIYIRLYKPIFFNDTTEFTSSTPQIDKQHVKFVNEEVEVTLVPPEELPKLQLQEINEKEDEDEEEEEDDDDGVKK